MTSSEKEKRRELKAQGLLPSKNKVQFEQVFDKETGKAIGKKDANGNVILYK